MTKRKKKSIKQHREEAFTLGMQAAHEDAQASSNETIKLRLAIERANIKAELAKSASLERFQVVTNVLNGMAEMVGLAIQAVKSVDGEVR